MKYLFVLALLCTSCTTGGAYKTAFWEKQCAPDKERIAVGEHGSPLVQRYCAGKDLVYTGDIIRRFGGSDKPDPDDVYYYRGGMVWLNPDDTKTRPLRDSLTPVVFPYPSEIALRKGEKP